MNYEDNEIDIVSEIDQFTSKYLDHIIEISHKLKSTFDLNPAFLEHFRSTHLTNFILECIFFPNTLNNYYNNFDSQNKTLKYHVFKKYYNKELYISFCIIYNNFKQFNINQELWNMFCFKYSYTLDLY